MTNATRFLNAYAKCENQLTKMLDNPSYIPFSQLISRCAKRSKVISLNQQALREYNELRNAIVHNRGKEEEIIAEPCDSVTEDIERIAKLLCEPSDILKYASMPVRVIDMHTRLRDAFNLMQSMHTSKIPVYQDGRYVGILTLEQLAKVAVNGNLDTTKIEDILSDDKNTQILFVSKSQHVDVVFQYFDQLRDQGLSLLAILITENGKQSEKPLGIITIADLPKILKYYK